MPPVGFEPKISARKRPVAARLLRSWVRIPPGAWIFVCCEWRVLSGRGLCDELITHPEDSYRLCCVVVCHLETSRIGAPYIYDISSLRVKQVAEFMSLTLNPTELEAISVPYPYRAYSNVKKTKTQGGNIQVYVLVKGNYMESGTNFLEAARCHTSEGSTVLAKPFSKFGFIYDK
jgi:hypothetical protein